MTDEMKKDIKFLLDAVDEFQEKYNGIYVTLDHVLGEKEIAANCTISWNYKNFEYIMKYSNGKYTS